MDIAVNSFMNIQAVTSGGAAQTSSPAAAQNQTTKMNDATTTVATTAGTGLFQVDIMHRIDPVAQREMRMTIMLLILAWFGAKALLFLLSLAFKK